MPYQIWVYFWVYIYILIFVPKKSIITHYPNTKCPALLHNVFKEISRQRKKNHAFCTLTIYVYVYVYLSPAGEKSPILYKFKPNSKIMIALIR